MVKFGKHQQVFLDSLGVADGFYTVPYDQFKHLYIPGKKGEDTSCNEDDTLSSDELRKQFVEQWKMCLEKASCEFNGSVSKFWTTIFDAIDDLPATRGALPDQALRLYLSTLSKEEVGEPHLLLKQMHATALLNSEALRKLVKKFDKQQGKCDNSSSRMNCTGGQLLPLLYSSSFCIGLPTLESGLKLIRNFMGIDGEDEDEEEAKHLEETRRRLRNLSMDWSNVDFKQDLQSTDVLEGGFLPLKKRDSDAVLIQKRNSELQWLRKFVKEFPQELIGKLVGHRGFHSVHDRSDRRPIENSMIAYEACWTNGIQLCECDIALTKDERIILCHDETFSRLALDPSDELCQRKVQELTYREIISLPLKSGSRPPLLFDVLRSAEAIGGGARMIVEIKPGNVEAGTALARMFAKHPNLMRRCAVVMSFDAFAMHQFRKELTHVMDHLAMTHTHDLLLGGSSGGISSTQSSRRNSDVQLHTSRSHHRRMSSQNFVIPTAYSIGQNLGEEAKEAGLSLPTKSPSHRHIESYDNTGMDVSVNVNVNARANLTSNMHNSLQGEDDYSGFGQFHMLGERALSITGASAPLVSIPANETPAMMITEATVSSLNTLVKNQEEFIPQYCPKLLLITGKACDNPHQECELQVSVKDLSRIDAWLRGGAAGPLDGVYLQYEPEMITDEAGRNEMKKLAAKYDVGIWGANPHPDDFDTFERLVRQCGVQYVNSSLPRKFMTKTEDGNGR